MEHDIRESLPIIRMTIVDEQETIETVSLRQLHNWLKIDTRFNDWMARRVQE